MQNVVVSSSRTYVVPYENQAVLDILKVIVRGCLMYFGQSFAIFRLLVLFTQRYYRIHTYDEIECPTGHAVA